MNTIQQVLAENVETAQTDFNNAQDEVDWAMRNLQVKKVALAREQQLLREYEERRHQADTEVGEDNDGERDW